MKLRHKLEEMIQGDMHGVHYAVSIAIATAVLWITVQHLAKTNPIWAISSMVATSDPAMKQALMFFRARLINTLLGCAVGLLFILLGGSHLIKLPLAMAVTVLLSSYVVRVPTMWRQGPITAAFVIAAGIEHHAKTSAFQAGLNRVSEVLFGCIIGLVVGYTLSKVWPLPDDKPAAKAVAAK